MRIEEREALESAVGARLEEARPWMPEILRAAQEQVPDAVVWTRDGYSALRYLRKVLWCLRNPDAVLTMDRETMWQLLIEATEGATRFRIAKRAAQLAATGG